MSLLISLILVMLSNGTLIIFASKALFFIAASISLLVSIIATACDFTSNYFTHRPLNEHNHNASNAFCML